MVIRLFPRSNYRGFFTTGESYCTMYTLCSVKVHLTVTTSLYVVTVTNNVVPEYHIWDATLESPPYSLIILYNTTFVMSKTISCVSWCFVDHYGVYFFQVWRSNVLTTMHCGEFYDDDNDPNLPAMLAVILSTLWWYFGGLIWWMVDYFARTARTADIFVLSL